LRWRGGGGMVIIREFSLFLGILELNPSEEWGMSVLFSLKVKRDHLVLHNKAI
jgi:hypothetical protein